ncbi:MAG: phosphoribosylglycinamide formyltransferase [Cyanobacteria bacterium]|nr:phosphoribosylglycinamide formyltransferase [Cyanobacteria bacterium CG_2015-16_32_12]NCO77168.1 phosphoribosylglycinamide formyltransferase [Cyanobacteria bacterium CG_2015-22_32_23]NCQ04375.1 phosphoribosylglycinamide formyltransferase [Cyanobacteria bacterium CG_2015-09_32_10]NCQ41013.1 phosphoribosylglycinamide formyltransferase [Cyanobacteria bacterium CG_2015-04_32_10]
MDYLISPSLPADKLALNHTIKLGVMASGSGSNFEAIAQAINKGELNAKIEVLIYNNPSAKVKEKADRLNIPSILLNHRNYSHREALDQAIVEVFKVNKVEWVVMAGWMRIITDVLLNAFPHRVINIHPSLLPSFKGINAIEKALKSQVKITGCTVHLVDLEVDSGPILVQAAVPILPDDTAETLHHRIQIQEHRIITQGIALAALKS